MSILWTWSFKVLSHHPNKRYPKHILLIWKKNDIDPIYTNVLVNSTGNCTQDGAQNTVTGVIFGLVIGHCINATARIIFLNWTTSVDSFKKGLLLLFQDGAPSACQVVKANCHGTIDLANSPTPQSFRNVYENICMQCLRKRYPAPTCVVRPSIAIYWPNSWRRVWRRATNSRGHNAMEGLHESIERHRTQLAISGVCSLDQDQSISQTKVYRHIHPCFWCRD